MARYKKSFPEPTLLKALKFVACATGEADNERFCLLAGNRASACNSMIAAGTGIEEDLYAAPDVEQMMLALARCQEIYAITQLSAERLYLRSGDFQAYIPCCDPSRLATVNPDAAIAAVDDSLTAALKSVSVLASDKGQHIATATIMLRSGSCVGTNRSVILESWHGHDLPTVLIPKAAATAVIRAGRKLTGFGCSEHTVTFWFEDESWIRCRTFSEQWPDISKILNVECDPSPVSSELFDAISRVAPFSDDNNVHCGNDAVSSHAPWIQNGSKLTLNVQGLHYPRVYDIKNLKIVAPYIQKWDASQNNVTLFFGKGVRGAITHIPELRPCEKHQQYDPQCDDCTIPF